MPPRVPALSALIIIIFSSLAVAQVPSDLDTMRIVVDPVYVRGTEIDIVIRLRVTDTLGAFAYRLRYDTTVFEPVQDTFPLGNDTVVGIVATDLHPGIFEQFAGSVRSPGVITFLGADLDLDTASLYLPGSWQTVGMRWRVLTDAPIGPSLIYFENDSTFPATWNAFSDWWGDDFIRPVFANVAANVICECICFAEPGQCDGSLTIADVVGVVNIAFRSISPNPPAHPQCTVIDADVNCDGTVSIVDVVKVIAVAFRGADPTTTFCNPCE